MRKFLTRSRGIRFQETPFHIRNNPFKRLIGNKRGIIKRHTNISRSIKDNMTGFFRQIFPRCILRDMQEVAKRNQCLFIKSGLKTIPRRNRPLCDRTIDIRNNEFFIHIKPRAQTITMRTSTLRIVKRKEPRFNFFNREARNRTSIFCRTRKPIIF